MVNAEFVDWRMKWTGWVRGPLFIVTHFTAIFCVNGQKMIEYFREKVVVTYLNEINIAGSCYFRLPISMYQW